MWRALFHLGSLDVYSEPRHCFITVSFMHVVMHFFHARLMRESIKYEYEYESRDFTHLGSSWRGAEVKIIRLKVPTMHVFASFCVD